MPTSESQGSTSRPALAWRWLLALAGAKLLLHLALGGRYGFHRDELYYLVCGRHLDWGYVDHPPLVPFVARIVETLAGPSLRALRSVTALGGAALVLLAGWTARELGGGRRAQALAALALLASPIYLMTNQIFQTVTFDQLAWAACVLLLAVLLSTGRERLWVPFGIVAGLGLLAKPTILVFGAALVLALLATPARRQLRSPWLWAGGAIVALCAAPNIVWQLAHGWPTLEFMANRGARTAAEISPGLFLGLQGLFVGPGSLPLFAAGGVWLFRRANAAYRPLGWLALVAFVIFAASGGKPYYPAPLYPLLFAAGAVWAERRAEQRGWRRLRWVLPAIVVAGSLPTLWMVLPVLPERVFAQRQDAWPHKELHEMFGWQELVDHVAAAYQALPEAERARTGILTDAYGEAAAIEVLGAGLGLPRAASAHNSFYFWGPPDAETVIAVAWSSERLERLFAEVEGLAPVANRLGVRNEASRKRIYLCRGLRAAWAEIWPALRSFV
jgi:4-amino-4-deoxy-L-arabinose transferase-like glycosyltransferase